MAVYLDGTESILSPSLVTHEYTLTMSLTPGAGGIIIPTAGEHAYIEGKVVLLVAAPETGYKFVRWDGDAVEDTDSMTTQITMDSDKTVEAVFFAQVTLTLVASGGGTTVPAPAGSIIYKKDEVATIKAVANDGYELNAWGGDASAETEDTIYITMDADKIVTVSFKQTTETTSTDKYLYFNNSKNKAYWYVNGKPVFFATAKHGNLNDLDKDQHEQYLNTTRHDVTERHTLGTIVPQDDSKLDKNIGDSLPTASAAYRGQFYTLRGSPDTLHWCRSTDGGTTFEWKTVTLS